MLTPADLGLPAKFIYTQYGPRRLRVERAGECLLWTGTTLQSGHGQLTINGECWKAHRYVYTIFRGPIPDGYDVHHICERPACVYIAHLDLLPCEEHKSISSQRDFAACGHVFDWHHWEYSTQRGRLIFRRRCRVCTNIQKQVRRDRAYTA